MLRGDYYKDYLASRVIAQGKQILNHGNEFYDKVYYQTTEDLTKLAALDLKDKDVIAVQSSSDHLFTSRYCGAKSTETFDFNRLTIFYYYLRKWSIEYMGEILPNIFSKNWLWKCIKQVECKTPMEKNAFDYYFNHLKDGTNFVKLFYNIDVQPDGNTPYRTAEELKPFIEEDPRFYVRNIFLPLTSHKQYDVADMSNILDWARGDKHKITVARDNLDKLLRPDGVVFCSYIVSRNMDTEEEIFAEKFVKENNPFSQTYTYRRK